MVIIGSILFIVGTLLYFGSYKYKRPEGFSTKMFIIGLSGLLIVLISIVLILGGIFGTFE